QGEKGRRAALRCCVYELLFICATNRAPYVAPLSKALHLVRDRSPQPVSLEDLAQYINFEIHRPRRFLFRQSLALKSRDVLVVDVADEPLAELFGERLNKMLIGFECIGREIHSTGQPFFCGNREEWHPLALWDAVNR